MPSKYLQCRLCNWKYLKWKRAKGGKIISTPKQAWEKLETHFSVYHPDEYVQLMECILNEEEEKLDRILKNL